MQRHLGFIILSILFCCLDGWGQCIPDLPPIIPEYSLGGRTITVTDVHINTGGPIAGMNPGEVFDVSFDWTIGPNLTACPGCVTFFHFGLSNVSVPGSPGGATTYPNTHCMGSVFPGQTSNSSGSFTAPMETGFYYITLDSEWVFWCHQYAVNHCNNKIIALIQVGIPLGLQVAVDSISHLSGCNTDDGSIGIGVSDYTGCFSTDWEGPGGYTATNQTVITDLAAGEYEVTVTDISGCDTTLYFTIDDVLSESVNLGADTLLCEGETLQLNAELPGASYLWQDGSTGSIYMVDQAGTYSVEVSTGNCTTQDDIVVDFQELDPDLGPDVSQCGGSILLDVIMPGADYSWTDGSTESTLDVTNSGSYWVNVSIGRCSSADTIDINIDVPFTVDIGNDTSICGGSLILDASHPNASYLWQDGTTGPTNNISAGGLYTVEVTSGECSATDDISIVVDIPQVVDLGPDTSLCSGVITLDASVIGGSYLWQDGSVMPTYIVTESGSYSVVASTGNSCPDLSDAIEVIFLEAPVLSNIPDSTLCAPASYTVDLASPSIDYLWSDGSTSASNTITSSGSNWVELSNACGSVTDTFLVSIEDCECQLITPSAFSPDANGYNEFFLPIFPCEISFYKMRIYNRWGKMIFESEDAVFGWNGSWKGVLQEMDIYTWIIEYIPVLQNEAGPMTMETGYVMLFR